MYILIYICVCAQMCMLALNAELVGVAWVMCVFLPLFLSFSLSLPLCLSQVGAHQEQMGVLFLSVPAVLGCAQPSAGVAGEEVSPRAAPQTLGVLYSLL